MAKESFSHGVALLSIVPMRAEPSEKAEMTSQLLFGEHFQLIRERKGWYYIRNDFDGYEGFVSPQMVYLMSHKQYQAMSGQEQFVSANHFQQIIQAKKKEKTWISAGASIPNFNGKYSFRIANQRFRFKGRPAPFPGSGRDAILKTAFAFLNAPYLWGGRSPLGFDCSGFTQIVYKICGRVLPRDAGQQVKHGSVVNWVNEGRPGDLAFFQNPEGLIVHVGILIGDGKIIHCSGQVRVDFVDHEGINHSGTRRYTHHLRVVKDMIGD